MVGVVTASVINAFSSNEAANTQADAATQAANTQANANKYASDIQMQMFNKNVALQSPWREAGVNALSRLSTGLQPGGQFATPFSQTNWQQDPGYAFRLQEGNKLLNQTAAARGGLISGNALKAAERYGQEMGSQEYQNAFQRYYREREAMMNPLQSLAGVGQTSAQTLGGQAGQYGANVGSLASMTGQSQANALTSAANARASSYGGIGQGIGQGLQGLYNNWNTISSWFGGGDKGNQPYLTSNASDTVYPGSDFNVSQGSYGPYGGQ